MKWKSRMELAFYLFIFYINSATISMSQLVSIFLSTTLIKQPLQHSPHYRQELTYAALVVVDVVAAVDVVVASAAVMVARDEVVAAVDEVVVDVDEVAVAVDEVVVVVDEVVVAVDEVVAAAVGLWEGNSSQRYLGRGEAKAAGAGRK